MINSFGKEPNVKKTGYTKNHLIFEKLTVTVSTFLNYEKLSFAQRANLVFFRITLDLRKSIFC